MGTALLLSIVIGVAFGVISAVKQYSVLDYVLTILGFLGRSVPVFFVGMLLIYFFCLKLRLFPVSGIATVGAKASLGDNLRHLALPLISLSILRIAEFLRYSRASMLEVLGADYVWTARSKGVKERRIIMTHAFRNALIPLITLIGLNIPVLFGGAIIIEQVFQWPGIGMLFISAVDAARLSLAHGAVAHLEHHRPSRAISSRTSCTPWRIPGSSTNDKADEHGRYAGGLRRGAARVRGRGELLREGGELWREVGQAIPQA